MCAKILLLFCPLISTYARAASTFDQRQSGDLNVQVDLKDLRVIALMKKSKEEYVDYDYAYDYSEMTIKPQNGTTSKPLNVSSTTTTTTEAADFNKDKITTTSTNFTVQTTVAHSVDLASSNTGSTQNPFVTDMTTETTEIDLNVPLNATTMPPSGADCRKGFNKNQKGECELKLHGPGNALLKLVKLSQKLKLRRENRRDSQTLDTVNN